MQRGLTEVVSHQREDSGVSSVYSARCTTRNAAFLGLGSLGETYKDVVFPSHGLDKLDSINLGETYKDVVFPRAFVTSKGGAG